MSNNTRNIVTTYRVSSTEELIPLLRKIQATSGYVADVYVSRDPNAPSISEVPAEIAALAPTNTEAPQDIVFVALVKLPPRAEAAASAMPANPVL